MNTKSHKLGFWAIICMAIIGFTSMAIAGGEFKFKEESHDYGTIPQGTPASYEFEFSNAGDSPIIINNVKPSCGCSVAEFPKTPIKPGTTGTIKVTYNAAVKGPFTKQFTVLSNSKTAVRTLVIKGKVE